MGEGKIHSLPQIYVGTTYVKHRVSARGSLTPRRVGDSKVIGIIGFPTPRVVKSVRVFQLEWNETSMEKECTK
jgi:hypothetical protein